MAMLTETFLKSYPCFSPATVKEKLPEVANVITKLDEITFTINAGNLNIVVINGQSVLNRPLYETLEAFVIPQYDTIEPFELTLKLVEHEVVEFTVKCWGLGEDLQALMLSPVKL